MPNESRLTIAWGVLVILTLASFGAASAHKGGLGFVLIMSVAGIKARLVTSFYMDLRRFSILWQRLFDILLVVAVALVAGLHAAGYLIS